MPKRRLIVFPSAVTLLAAAIIMAHIPSREPFYKGKRLSEWARAYAANTLTTKPDTSEQRQARDAIRQIGTNAIPDLLKWINYEQPVWKTTWYPKINPLLQKLNPNWPMWDDKRLGAEDAICAFEVLGPKAAGAIPELSRMVNETRAPETSWRAARALAFLGDGALHPLLSALTNRQPTIRLFAASAMEHFQSDSRPAAPVLFQLLKDQYEPVAAHAARTLGKLKLEPDLSVSALITSLRDSRVTVREFAAIALGAYGEQARLPVPALLTLTSDLDLPARLTATNALLKILPEALTNTVETTNTTAR